MLNGPFYLIDKHKLRKNMFRIKDLEEKSGAKALLALKCFASWAVFPFMREYMSGTTSSSLYELRLGAEEFGGETHAYSVAWADYEFAEVEKYADKIIFNSVSQLNKFANRISGKPIGLRLNPQISSSNFDLADPARPFSRLGELEKENVKKILPDISGFMIHNNCENNDFAKFDQMLHHTEREFSDLFHQVSWVSLGGGIDFTADNYPLDLFAARLKKFAEDFKVQVYLEPGEAAITNSTSLEAQVLDITHNGRNIAIIDSSIEAHMLDLLVYREKAKILPNEGDFEYMICGKSCLAGDVFGSFKFPKPLEIGDRISISNAGGYTIVKKNWFNGLNMPAIAVKGLDGTIKIQKTFDYKDYKESLS